MRVPVYALLISHNGARWLPTVVQGIRDQVVKPDRLIAIDTGSRDDSVHLLREDAAWDVRRLDGVVSFAESVRTGLQALPESADENSWIWLLHDDSAPDRHALERLVGAARENTNTTIFGPKLREWPSLRRLVEMGVTIAGNGRRETGLERGEYDQGQHDQRRVVLAANTAGMLIRRDVLEEVGFDDNLPVFGNDLDFGWRAARAGHRTLIVPDAIVFHAEAAHRGLRNARLTRRKHFGERQAGVYTLLANSPGWTVPFKALRLAIGSVFHALGLLLLRAPLEAWDELAGTGSVLLRPGRLLRARRDRARAAAVPHDQVKHLLAPPWLPLRHALDAVGDVYQAAVDIVREKITGRAIRSADLIGTDDEDEFASASLVPGLIALTVRNLTFWLGLGMLVLAVIGARDVLSGGPLHGGALLSAGSWSHWWSTYLSAHHDLGIGTGATAPAYLLPLAMLGTLVFGKTTTLIFLLFLLTPMLAALGAQRFFRLLGVGTAARYLGAVGYGLLPVASGAWGEGRFGTLVAAILLPYVAAAALRLTDGSGDRRWRAAWRVALLTAIIVMFVPSVYLLVVIGSIGFVIYVRITRPKQWRRPDWWGLPVAIVVTAPLLALPWVIGTLGTPQVWLTEAGSRFGVRPGPAKMIDLFAGHPSANTGAPVVLGLLLAGLAVVAIVREDTRSRVARCWWVAAPAAGLAALLSLVTVELPGLGHTFTAYAGTELVLLQGALVTAVVIAADGLVARARAGHDARAHAFAMVGVLIAAIGLVTVAGTAAWWLKSGSHGELTRSNDTTVPAYMTEVAASDKTAGVLVIRGTQATGLRYLVLRDTRLWLGDDGILALTPTDPAFARTLSSLLTDPEGTAADKLSGYGITYLYLPSPVSSAAAGTFDAAEGLSRAGAPTGDASWRVQKPASTALFDNSAQPLRWLWLTLQFLAIVAIVVLTVPSRPGVSRASTEGKRSR